MIERIFDCFSKYVPAVDVSGQAMPRKVNMETPTAPATNLGGAVDPTVVPQEQMCTRVTYTNSCTKYLPSTHASIEAAMLFFTLRRWTVTFQLHKQPLPARCGEGWPANRIERLWSSVFVYSCYMLGYYVVTRAT
jgi:hypothetical protein